ncbi:MAG: hypothetical protein HDR88_06080 [Bacteroides sp.]|nr:hypothetical protein [Bacteroides sp.]MBD5356558.1 hypothetical protein [Bacteroides sp.]
MSILDTLITDRVQDDARRARELCAKGWDKMTQADREAYLGGLKGGYGPTDMNRVVGAMEYIDARMKDAQRESVYVPTVVPHAVPVEFDENGMVTHWKRWSDTVWIDYDYADPLPWFVHLENINRLWVAARRFRAAVLARYDPDGNGYIPPDREIRPGDFCTVLDSVGLLELRITAVCPSSVTAAGVAWVVSESDTGWEAVLDYVRGPYPDIGNALSALKISCGADAVTDATFTLSATLRYDYDVTAGTCAVRWSPFMTWDEACTKYGLWDGAKPLTWDEAARGGAV